MRYVQPYGITDPDASYINGDPSIGRMGSIPPAAAFEHPMRELVTIIEKNLLTPTELDLKQAFKAIRSQRGNYAEDTGSANALAVAFDPPITNYTIGLPIRVKVKVTNTSASVINAGGGIVQIRRPNGSQTAGGDLPAGGLVDLVYDGTAFQLINFGGTTGGGTEPPPAQVFLTNIPYAVDSSPTPNQIIANFSPALTSIQAGSVCLVKIANTNTGPTQMNAQNLGNRPVYATAVGDLIYSDLLAGAVHFMRYDGSVWWIDPSPAIVGNVTFNCANNAQVDDLFVRLSRKRIAANAFVTVNLLSGVYGTINTYHVDADRILLQGTMLAAAPDKYSFSKSGNSASARAQDAANNIAMLRSRFGTEVRHARPNWGIHHRGPGQIQVRNILVTGEHTAGYEGCQPSVGCEPGGSMILDSVCVWGSHWDAFAASAGAITMSNCFSSAHYRSGFACGVGGTIVAYSSGSYGGDWNGAIVFGGSSLTLYNNNEVAWNGNCGINLWGLGVGGTNIAGQALLGNTLDISAASMSTFSIVPGTSVGPVSPPLNVVGNANSIITG